MKLTQMRKGSALLVVLGMTAFMIISAVAFSAYMRYSRLPSSFLRRMSSSRWLAKTALANAIDDIDSAVGDYPHPGVIKSASGGGNSRTEGRSGSAPRNTWKHRVFFGNGTESETQIEGSNGALELTNAKTVPTLSMEAMAYVPPALIDEVRHYSRRTPTAAWHGMKFDVGRYAYTAIDVSDYFDINRLFANRPRSSASNGRISLAYLFEGEGHKSSGSSAAGSWDSFMQQFRTEAGGSSGSAVDYSSKLPLVSIADLNMAMGQMGAIGEMRSPIYEYLMGNSEYMAKSGSDQDEMIDRMTFITDSWFPVFTNATQSSGSSSQTRTYSLAENQPFDTSRLDNASGSGYKLGDVMFSDGNIGNRDVDWKYVLSRLGCCALYDYLDTDHYPLSLAIPTVERMPMICGLSPQISGLSMSVEKSYENGTPENPNQISGDEKTRRVTVTAVYKLKLDGSVSAEALTVFPFAQADEKDENWKIDGRCSFFFMTGAAEGPGIRVDSTSPLHLTKDVTTGWDDSKALMNVKLSETAVSRPSFPVQNAADTVRKVTLSGEGLSAFSGTEMLRVTYEWDQKKDPSSMLNDWQPTFEAALNGAVSCGFARTEAKSEIRPLRFDTKKGPGEVDNDFAQTGQSLVSSLESKEVRLGAAIWLRIKAGDRVVDMAPACVYDDETQNGESVANKEALASQLGAAYPVFGFSTGMDAATFSEKGLDALATEPRTAEALAPKTIYATDPRFNHSPEDWFRQEGSLDASTWLSQCGVGGGNRDEDIFMATSDAGYLQSASEIAFISAFTDLSGNNGGVMGDYRAPGTRDEFPSAASQTANDHLMWQTYDPFEMDRDNYNELRLVDTGTGYKVNPYSDSTNILMSVFANTPLDWKRASSNTVSSASLCAGQCSSADQFNSRCAWNEYSSGGSLAYVDLARVAEQFMSTVREVGLENSTSAGSADGLAAIWERLVSNDRGDGTSGADASRLFGVLMEDSNSDHLWSTDRKFFYGYWRDCFAARQQLYLIFIRAEPTMMGSGSVSATPPQLGARAVALVWRDPQPTNGMGKPHATRVLFYHQLD